MPSSRLQCAAEMLALVAESATTTSRSEDASDDGDGVIRVEGDGSGAAWGGRELRAAPFLSAVREGVLPVLDALGAGMYVVKTDVNGNVQRIDSAAKAMQTRLLLNIVRRDLNRKTHGGSRSDTKALLWLKRALDFTCGMVRLLVEDGEMEVARAAEIVYVEKLKPFHGWISQGAFSVAIRCGRTTRSAGECERALMSDDESDSGKAKLTDSGECVWVWVSHFAFRRLVPARTSFLEKAGDAGATEEDTLRQLSALIDAAEPIICDINSFLCHYDLDDPTVV